MAEQIHNKGFHFWSKIFQKDLEQLKILMLIQLDLRQCQLSNNRIIKGFQDRNSRTFFSRLLDATQVHEQNYRLTHNLIIYVV